MFDSSRRDKIDAIARNLPTRRVHHASLWLDRYLKTQSRDDEAAKTEHNKSVAAIVVPGFYGAFYRRWRQTLSDMAPQVQMREAVASGRIVVGLGAESVLETSITLHHTYGVPYIPGSALKGLAAAYAHQRLQDDGWRKGGEYHTIMFGTTERSGYVTFFDGLYVPGTGVEKRPLHADVMAIHHKSYYDGTGKPPADWDSPTIVPFLSATGRYLIAIGGPVGWANKALELLGLALNEMGVGAKKSSGYGRMTLRAVDESGNTTPPESETATPNVAMAPQMTRTVLAKVGGVGAEDAAIQPAPGIRPGRARFAPDLPRRPRFGDQVRLQLDEANRPVLIIAIVEPE